MCDRAGCERPGIYQPILVLTPDGKAKAYGEIKLKICEECHLVMTPNDLITPEGWKQLVAAFMVAGKAEPRREMTALTWKKIEQGGTNE